jgi:glycosyltransferase involved in cell wall biosynthesis
LVVLEAFARGIPVVAAGGGALPEVVKDGGLVVPAGNSAALAEALIRVLGDPILAEELGRRGRAVYETHYTLDRFGTNLVALVTEREKPIPKRSARGADRAAANQSLRGTVGKPTQTEGEDRQ